MAGGDLLSDVQLALHGRTVLERARRLGGDVRQATADDDIPTGKVGKNDLPRKTKPLPRFLPPRRA